MSDKDANQAIFSKMTVNNANDLVINNVKFDGIGGANAGTGLTVTNSSKIKVLNSDFTDLKVGSYIGDSDGIKVSNNTFTRMYIDAMNFSDIQRGEISKNYYQESGSQQGYIHKDFIQFWTDKWNDQKASSNIKIFENTFYSKDNQTHGIFIHNEWRGQKYQNIDIYDNYLQSSHTHAITVTYANDLEIRNNTLVKYGNGTPVINVTPDSTNVKILNNTAPSVADRGDSTWVVANNKETVPGAYQWTNDIKTGVKIANVGPFYGVLDKAGLPVDYDYHNTYADSLSLQGTSVVGTISSTVKGFDFLEGDTITFSGYEAGTFAQYEGGNALEVDITGSTARIDSLIDLQELSALSPYMEATVDGDTLLISIAQTGGAQTIAIEGWGEEYAATYDTLLF